MNESPSVHSTQPPSAIDSIVQEDASAARAITNVSELLLHLAEDHIKDIGVLDATSRLVIDAANIDEALVRKGINESKLIEILSPYIGDDPNDFPFDIDERALVENMEWQVKRRDQIRGKGQARRKYPVFTFKPCKIPGGAYNSIIERVFFDNYLAGNEEVAFLRTEFESIAKSLAVNLPKNLGDIIYSYRYRRRLPRLVRETQREGKEWIIRGAGDGKYTFRLSKINRIAHDPAQPVIRILESTPQLIAKYAKKKDEQELLAKIRYNRLIDIFLGVTSFSLQSHLRTKVSGIGQIEIDEFYVGVDCEGNQFVIPVQAKTGSDKLAAVQTEQDIAYCNDKFPNAACRAVSAQFLSATKIAMFELDFYNDSVRKIKERIYELVTAEEFEKLSTQALNTPGESGS